jgi:uncharacterized protein (UPF0335 family)
MTDETPPERDFAKLFDLNRTGLVKNMVERMETCLRQIEGAQDDLKKVIAECKDAEFRKHDIAAMKRVAKLRLSDKVGDAAEQLAALERVSGAIGMDLFHWAASH